MTSKHQHPFLQIKRMISVAGFHQYNLNLINKLQRIGKEKNAVKQLDEEKTLLRTVSSLFVFSSLEEVKEALEKDPSEEVVKLLCEIGVDLEQRDYTVYTGETALHFAVRGNKRTNSSYKFHANPRIVKVLLEHGASVHAKDHDGNTPLLTACGNGNLEVVQTLIKYHADVHSTNEICETPLHKACSGGHLEIVQELLKYEPNINAVRKGDEMTPLMSAALSGHFEIVEELLKNGADINFNDPKNGSALHLSMEYEHERVVITLLKNGCNANVRAKLTWQDVHLPDCTPFELALDKKSIDFVKIIAYHET